jgi:hypothetical protein
MPNVQTYLRHQMIVRLHDPCHARDERMVSSVHRSTLHSMPHTVDLTRHLGTHSDAVRKIEARVCRTDEALDLKFMLTGDLSRLRIPPTRSPRRADRLWEHTCFEAFMAMNDKREYYEFNFAPSREWAAYVFRSYRDGEPCVNPELEPRIVVRSAGDRLALDALIHPRMIPPGVDLRLGLSAVIEEKHGILSYWALKHPAGKPDFHHSDGFALNLPARDEEVLNPSSVDE